ncbi:hypothetical protein [uncultured Eubacterium sp.]|uniref:hypothetical protein n=1 Tax=uncultured Eubacterium sp. TaxID=165185 RepID=UPI002595C639|nr:hypothetical protein [uncultured Eubacterium sp.]
MITEDYCSYEVAKLLKEKGFDIFKPYGWDEELFDKEHPRNFSLGFDSKEHWISCPSQSIAMKWLREVYGLHIWVDYSRLDCNEKQPYLWNIVETKIDGDYWEGTYNKSPKNAVESALNYTLKNLI